MQKNDTEEDGRRQKHLIGISVSGRKRHRVPLHFQVARLTAFSGRRRQRPRSSSAPPRLAKPAPRSPSRSSRACSRPSATTSNTSPWMRGVGGAIAPFGSMVPVFPCLIRPNSKTLLATREVNSPGVVFPSPTCWRCFMPALAWCCKWWPLPCAPMICPAFSTSIPHDAPRMSWWPTGAAVPLSLLRCSSRAACRSCCGGTSNRSSTSHRGAPTSPRTKRAARGHKANRAHAGWPRPARTITSSSGANPRTARPGWTRRSVLGSPIASQSETCATGCNARAFASRPSPWSPPLSTRSSPVSRPWRHAILLDGVLQQTTRI